MTWATDHIFVAGGDYVSEYWGDFQHQSGVGAVVTVSPDRPGAYLEPAPWAALWLPVAEETDYTLDQLALGAQFIEAALAAGHKVLLHGPHGVHRTRPLVAAHLIANGKTVPRVVHELEQKPWLPPYQGDIALLEALKTWLNGGR
jgi:protein-tyrosine phosphatase